MEPAAQTDCLPEPARRRARVLLVDDRAENLTVLRAVLAGLDAELVAALSGEEALRCLLHEEFALILLDVQMPGLNGYETAELIRARDRSRATPIVFVTAAGMSAEEAARGYAAGAVDYLVKPVAPEILRAKVTALLELWKARQELEVEVGHRRAAEAAIRELNAELEARVEQRTAELAVANWDLALEVTERRRAEAELAASFERLRELERLRDSLTHMVVHDMRTPLTTLLMGVESAMELGPLEPRQRECLEMAVNGGEALLTLINDMLDVSRLEEGSMPVRRQEVEISGLMARAAAQVAGMARARGVTLEILPPEGRSVVEADSDLLCRTLVNLLGNAVKFTPAGGRVSVRASTLEGETRFSVADTGEGIPREAFGRIFEKFGQVAERRDGRVRSTGLGLTFCRLAVEAHGGRIWVESEPGMGSTFTFTVPALAEAPELPLSSLPVTVAADGGQERRAVRRAAHGMRRMRRRATAPAEG